MRIRTALATGLGAAAAAVVGTVASKPNIDTWYAGLDKPRYVPPNAVFPIAWTSLYATIAWTSAAAIDRLRANGRDTIIITGICTNICCETTAREAAKLAEENAAKAAKNAKTENAWRRISVGRLAFVTESRICSHVRPPSCVRCGWPRAKAALPRPTSACSPT